RVFRTLLNSLVLLIALAVLGGWLSTGFYRLDLGEAAIILRLGEHSQTVRREGLNWHWPEPIEYDRRVNMSGVRTVIFGGRSGAAKQRSESGEAAEDGLFIQTADKNIVSIRFDLQYTVESAYAFVYSMQDPQEILKETTQASVRQVVGGMTVDEVLTKQKMMVEVDSRAALVKTLNQYAKDAGGEPAFAIDKINLQDVQPPLAVRAAFQEVSSAGQDEERSISAAKGDAQEILERARAEAVEVSEGSEAYKETVILEAQGESARFESILAEYLNAPRVTQTRLYLETMQEILPGVQKVIVEPGTVGVMPMLNWPGASPAAAPGPSVSPDPSASPVSQPKATDSAKEGAR
ncbi:FtsH protease activity modulator HflK, partial [Myxococcota bacterium]|nr:FtsH protease activity modulator HflK [Myxococcota bacterium]